MEAEKSDCDSTQQAGAEGRKKSNTIKYFVLGCGAIFIGLVVVGLAMTAKLGHDMIGLAVMSPPGKTVGGEAYVACSGFVDAGCDYFVTSTDVPDALFSMTTWSTESPFIGSLCFSKDGKLVATESNLDQYARNPFGSGPVNKRQSILYTHAYDFETEEYIVPESYPNSDNASEHRARHDRIVALMESHGGFGSKFTLTSDSPARIPLGFWEARRWWAKVQAGQDRKWGR